MSAPRRRIRVHAPSLIAVASLIAFAAVIYFALLISTIGL